MKQIFVIQDYKGRFETKFTAVPYRSGFNKELIQACFMELGYEVRFLFFPEIDFRSNDLAGKIFLYCSSEDHDGFYKSYVEDIVLGLKTAGAIVIPDYAYLKAHNNKLFMELLRDISRQERLKNIRSHYFGSIEELGLKKELFEKDTFVIKPAMGAMSKGVSAELGFNRIVSHSKKISKTPFYLGIVKDYFRRFRHKDYTLDSRFRKKFIIQNMIEGLEGDWKILIYGDKYYPLKRKNRKNDFKASGGGLLSYERDLPDGLLTFARTVYESFCVPNLSIDVGFNGSEFYLIEFQALYFGTYTIEKSEFYFVPDKTDWKICEGSSILEQVYARSISMFISKVLDTGV